VIYFWHCLIVKKARVFLQKRPSLGSEGKSISDPKKLENKKQKKIDANEEENDKNENKKEEENENNNSANTNNGEFIYVPILEENPKWNLLVEVLKEIEEEESKGNSMLIILFTAKPK
jgi:hypothetical protein